MSQGIAPQFAALGGSAAGGAMEAGYNFTFGGGSSSSSGMQPMDQTIGQQKRSELGDTGGEETKKRGRKKRGDELVVVSESGDGNGNGNGNGRKAKAKAKTKAEKREEKEAEQLTQPETDAPKSKNVPVKNKV